MEFDFGAISSRLRYNLLIGLIAPRPIALVTSLDGEGRVNAAPFSAYNYVGTDPALVVLGIGNRADDGGDGDNEPATLPTPKDSARNIRLRGEFVVNVVNEAIAESMNVCAIDFPFGISELTAAGLTTVPSTRVRVPRIAESPASMECREVTTLEIGRSRVIIGEVLHAHVRDEFVDPKGPYIRADAMHAVGRMNGLGNYVKTRDAFFTIPRIRHEDWEKRALRVSR